ncbi:hypothetical protein CGRA01v4_14300 [Colletotrichum graminicola]|nr:hypothetical protein CGRA01v4_14300 [Colletotrichum graminicola]
MYLGPRQRRENNHPWQPADLGYGEPISGSLPAYLSHPGSIGGCYFWIDSICINQRDAEKKRHHRLAGFI